MFRLQHVILAWVALVAMAGTLHAGTVYWQGTISDKWATGGNWSGGSKPGAADNVIVDASATRTNVVLTNSTTIISLVISNATLVFTNWTTKLTTSGNVTIRKNGRITLPSGFSSTQMSNRVHIACVDLTVMQGGTLAVDGKGYSFDTGPGKGDGPGAYAGGGGHGGKGGDGDGYIGGNSHDPTNAPMLPGSGGGSFQSGVPANQGGKGGGAIYVQASGTVTIDGTISANGLNSGWACGGGAVACFGNCGR